MNGTNIKQTGQVVVIGAGIVGLSAATWLSREGFNVVIVDRGDQKMAASYGNAGAIVPSSIIPVTVPGLIAKAPKMLLSPDSPLFLKWSYLPKLAPWLLRYLSQCRKNNVEKISAALAPLLADSVEQHLALSKGTQAEKYFRHSDYLFAFTRRSDFISDEFTWNIRKKHSVEWIEMTSDEIREYDPSLASSIGFAVRFPGHGFVTDPGAYISALKKNFRLEGGKIIKAEVKNFEITELGITKVCTDRETLECDKAVICGGAWSAGLTEKLGIRIPLETERGYHIELVEPSTVPRAPTMIASGKCVISPMEDRLRCAGIVEFGGLRAKPSEAPFKLLLKHVVAAFPSLRWKETRKWMGHRPAPSDSVPFIGEVASVKGLYMAFGHHHVGMTAGPKTGRIISDLVSGRKPDFDLQPYRPERFS